VFGVTDEFGDIRPFATDAIQFELQGPAELIGDNPFPLVGGSGAIWIRAKEEAGTLQLTATHPVLGSKKIQIELTATAPETI
jgi:beta-galactosidase